MTGNHQGITPAPEVGEWFPPRSGEPRSGESPRTGITPCIRGAQNRVLTGRHRAGCDGACLGCEPCTEAHCPTCHRSHAETTCPGCLAMARSNLKAIRQLVGCLPTEATHGRHALHQHHGIPGGDATVMLVPAAPSWAPGEARPVTVEVPGDPRPPLDVLTYWTNTWRAYTDDPTGLAPTMERACDYLDRTLHLVAKDAVFPSLARDLSLILFQVENVVHAGHRPERSRVPCWDCGSRLVKVWADRADHDHWRCPTCGEVYDHKRYERAKHEHLHSRGADRFVALMDAVAVTGRPEQTVRAWVRDGWVEARRSTTGRLEVWWPHVRERHRTSPVRVRRTP